MPKRKDSTFVYNVPSYRKVFPFVMPNRCDSLVYLDLELDFTNAIEYIRKNHSDTLNRKYRVFELFIAAFVRTVVLRPELNRFIMNKRLWQRNEISVDFVVKEDYSDDSLEHSVIAKFDPNMTLDEIAVLLDREIEACRDSNNSNSTDTLIDFFTSGPLFLITLLVSVLKGLDKIGLAPKKLTEGDGLHTTAFISNLGSIGLKSRPLHHHLYEWGSTSNFLTIGALKRNHDNIKDKTKAHYLLDVGVTLDERISDGYYFVHSLHILQDIINNPEQLQQKPESIQERPPKNKKEFRKFMKNDPLIL